MITKICELIGYIILGFILSWVILWFYNVAFASDLAINKTEIAAIQYSEDHASCIVLFKANATASRLTQSDCDSLMREVSNDAAFVIK